MGNLVADPEVKEISTSNGTVSVGKFTVAVSRRFKKKDGSFDEDTSFIDVEVWDTSAEVAEKILKKGTRVVVEGSFKQDRWTNEEGKTRSKIKIRSNRFYKFQPRDDSEAPASAQTEEKVAQPVAAGEDIPF
jgi:single-strand DNA-binding protein